MHFNSSAVNVGATAMLESRMMYPKRGFQCLQFYLYNSGNENDQLNIYVREYSAGNENGTLTLVEEIKGTVSTFLLFGFRVRHLNSTRCNNLRHGRGNGFITFQLRTWPSLFYAVVRELKWGPLCALICDTHLRHCRSVSGTEEVSSWQVTEIQW